VPITNPEKGFLNNTLILQTLNKVSQSDNINQREWTLLTGDGVVGIFGSSCELAQCESQLPKKNPKLS
jgi:hypothetical protein